MERVRDDRERAEREDAGEDRAEAGAYPTPPAQVRHHRRVAVLDVRRVNEFTSRHLDGAVNIPLHELLARIADVPAGEVWVHCAAGYRASVAASVLAARGVPVVAVDDSFDDNAAASGLSLTAA